MLLLLLNCVSRVRLCATLWAAACQASLSMGILQARILEWVAMPSSRGSSRSRDQTQVSCIAGRFFTPEPPGKPCCFYTFYQITAKRLFKLLSNAPPMRNNGLPGGASGKEPAFQCRRCKRCQFDPWVRKIPWRRKWHPTPLFLPGKPHGQRNLVGYSL